MTDNFKYDAFLSYAHLDIAPVRELAERLKGDGLQVWLDEWVIQAGDSIPLAIERGLESSRTLVLVMSHAAFDSEWVTLERHTALFRDPTNQQRRFIPLRLDDCDVKGSLRLSAYVDWRKKKDDEYARLLAACNGTDLHPSNDPTAKALGAWGQFARVRTIVIASAICVMLGLVVTTYLKQTGTSPNTSSAKISPAVDSQKQGAKTFGSDQGSLPETKIADFSPQFIPSDKGPTSLDAAAKLIANEIAKQLADLGSRQIVVSTFDGPLSLLGNGGVRIRRSIVRALARREIVVTTSATYGLQGRYAIMHAEGVLADFFPNERLQGMTVAVIWYDLTDAFGKSITGRYSGIVTVLDEHELCHLVNNTLVLPAQEPSEERCLRFKESLEKPLCQTRGDRIYAGARKVFGLEVLRSDPERSRDAAQSITPRLENGRAFVSFRRDDAYEIRLINGADYECAVLVSIDGKGLFEFFEPESASEIGEILVVLVPAKGDVVLRGWPRDGRSVSRFLPNQDPDAGERDSREPRLGTITATFAASWNSDSKRPDDEPALSAAAGSTKLLIMADFDFTKVERTVGVLRGSVTVFYTCD